MTSNQFEELCFAKILEQQEGDVIGNPFLHGEELKITLGLYLKAAMALKTPVRLTLADGSHLEGRVIRATGGGNQPSFHTLETSRGEVEVEDHTVAVFEKAPPELDLTPPGKLSRPSGLAEPQATDAELGL